MMRYSVVKGVLCPSGVGHEEGLCPSQENFWSITLQNSALKAHLQPQHPLQYLSMQGEPSSLILHCILVHIILF